jgi:hypothetical protein
VLSQTAGISTGRSTCGARHPPFASCLWMTRSADGIRRWTTRGASHGGHGQSGWPGNREGIRSVDGSQVPPPALSLERIARSAASSC